MAKRLCGLSKFVIVVEERKQEMQMGGLNYSDETPQSRARSGAFFKATCLTMVAWTFGGMYVDWAKEYLSVADLYQTCLAWGLVTDLLFVGLFDIMRRPWHETYAIFWGGVGVTGAFIAGSLTFALAGQEDLVGLAIAMAALFFAMIGTTAFFWPGYLFPYPKS